MSMKIFPKLREKFHSPTSQLKRFIITKKKNQPSDSDHRVNDMDKLQFKVWKVLLYY